MRKRFILSLLLFLLMSSPARSRDLSGLFISPDMGERIFAFLVSITNPEALELHMDELPDSEGRIRNISVFVRGACFGGLRVEKIAAESSFLELNPPSEWRLGRRHSLKVKNALRSNVEVVILEKDFNAALSSFPSHRSSLSLDFLPGSIRALGVYRTGWGNITAEAFSGLEISGGKTILLKDVRIRINGKDQTDAFRKEIENIQPLLDFEDFPIPVSISVLSTDNFGIRLSTRTQPKTIQGITFRYTRGLFPLPHPEPFEFSPEKFENGDVIFVNGKSWRSKAVTFFFRHPAGFSHSGVVRIKQGVPFVIHASPERESVEMEPLEDFLSPMEIDRAAVYRLKGGKGNAERASRTAWNYYIEKRPFDTLFDTNNEDEIYCTELIWKAYISAGIDLLGKERDSFLTPVPFYGNVLLPSGLSNSPLLEKVLTLE